MKINKLSTSESYNSVPAQMWILWVALKSPWRTIGQKRNRADQKMNLFTTLTDFWNYDSRNLISQNDSFFEQLYAHYQLRTEVPPKIQRSIWELILMHLPSTKMLAQYWVEVLSTALNSLVASLTSLKIWSTKSAKKRHLCASISAHSLHRQSV